MYDMELLNKNIDAYSLYIFDLDGTLYDQPLMRKKMAIRLLTYYMAHPFRIKELLLLQKFRSVKDDEVDGILDSSEGLSQRECYTLSVDDDNGKRIGIDEIDLRICKKVADKCGVDYKQVVNVVEYWIYKNPLDILYEVRDVKLLEYIAELRKLGKKVAILSDYPVKDKLEALGQQVDAFYCASDEGIGELKPSSKGILKVINDFSVGATDAVMVGDRMEKDGQAAIGANVDYLILERKVSKRNQLWHRLGI